MTTHAWPFQGESPVVSLTLAKMAGDLVHPVTCFVDTGYSDYLQVDAATMRALRLTENVIGQITSELADGSEVLENLAAIRVVIPELGIDRPLRCIINATYGPELLLVGNQFLLEFHAVIDYPNRVTTLQG